MIGFSNTKSNTVSINMINTQLLFRMIIDIFIILRGLMII